MTSTQTIDILLATYNGEQFVDKQIKSLVTQSEEGLIRSSGEKIRLIVRDDGSTDRTLDIIKKRVEYYKAKRENPMEVKILDDTKHTGSPTESFMKLLSVATGDYVMFSDQDDMWYRRKTETTFAKMKKCEEKYGKDTPILVHTDLSLMDEDGRKIAESFFDYQKLPREDGVRDSISSLLIQNTVTGCTVMMNRAAADLLREAPASEMVLMYDHFAAILVAATGHVAFVDEPLIRYRQHSKNAVGAHAAGSTAEYKARFSFGREKFLKDMDLSYRQTSYILKRYGDRIRAKSGQKTVDMMKEYSELIMAGKREKLEFFQKYGVYKNGAIKKIVQMIWC
jgi:Glycosyltransferases involved in cell wall biogenesis